VPGDFDQVKDRIDIVQLVSERVVLRKAGRTYKGLCPFHAEKTPSFTVDPERRTFHCFGCDAKGDAFDWVMRHENLEKVDALRSLAERAGVQLSTRPRQENEHAKRLLAAHDTALFYFRQALRGTGAGKAAAAYLAQRGITPETIDTFGLGYAPDSRGGLLAYLRKKGFSDEEAVGSGLVISTENGLFDRFYDRLMIPTRDAKGRIIAFGGRAMGGHPAKYINSPQTILFSKSATLYALDVARAAIRRSNEAVIVEGYFDAISCHQAALDNVVASQGTALTEEQYRVLDALKVDRAVVAFDADAAGTAAAEKRGRELVGVVRRTRSGALSTRTGLTVYVAELPTGDPDELARSDPAALREVLRSAKPVLEYVIDRVASRQDLGGPDGRRRFLAEALPLVAEEPDALTRELYLGRLATLTGVPQEALRDEAQRAPKATARRAAPPPTAPPSDSPVRGRNNRPPSSVSSWHNWSSSRKRPRASISHPMTYRIQSTGRYSNTCGASVRALTSRLTWPPLLRHLAPLAPSRRARRTRAAHSRSPRCVSGYRTCGVACSKRAESSRARLVETWEHWTTRWRGWSRISML